MVCQRAASLGRVMMTGELEGFEGIGPAGATTMLPTRFAHA